MTNKKNTIFCKMICCKCGRSLGIIRSDDLIQSDSFIPSIKSIITNTTNFDLYCNKCYIKEVLNINAEFDKIIKI